MSGLGDSLLKPQPKTSPWPLVAILSLIVMVPLSLVIGYKVGTWTVYEDAEFHGHGRWVWYHDAEGKMKIWQWFPSEKSNDR